MIVVCGGAHVRSLARSLATESTTAIFTPAMTPTAVGQLIALYEHITSTQGIVSGLNSFDQRRGELDKHWPCRSRLPWRVTKTRSLRRTPRPRCPSSTTRLTARRVLRATPGFGFVAGSPWDAPRSHSLTAVRLVDPLGSDFLAHRSALPMGGP